MRLPHRPQRRRCTLPHLADRDAQFQGLGAVTFRFTGQSKRGTSILERKSYPPSVAREGTVHDAQCDKSGELNVQR